MAVDYKKVLERLQKQSSKKGNNADYMDLVDGKNTVRVLPGHPNMEGFFEEVYYHRRNTGKNKGYTVICLNHGDPRAEDCLIEEALEPLKNSKDKQDKTLYSSQKAKPRFFMNVIDRSDDTPKILACCITAMKGILAFVTDEEYGDILDLKEGTDLVITKTGEGMDTEYTVTAKRNTSPVFEDKAKIKKLIGTSADDTQLSDLTQIKQQFADEPDKALKVWEEGWDSIKDDQDEDEDDKSKSKSKGKDKSSKAKKQVREEEPEEEEGEDITKYPRLKSRCSVCGEQRHKTPSGNVCPNGHSGVPPLVEGERPEKPSKKYLKEFPEPEEEEPEEEEPEEVEEEEEEEPKPAKSSKKAKKDTEESEDEGLDDLDEILSKHTRKK